MTCFRTLLLTVGVLFHSLLTAAAQEPIRFARTPDISPDGKVVAFSYLGDIWTVETIGGVARPVTMHQAHDLNPVFSPDGRMLAFSSNRHGGYDVFVVPSHGGKPRRLTFDSATDIVCGWTPDGQNILFASTRTVSFPPSFELYTVSVEGGAERRLNLTEGKEGTYSPKGDQLAYVRGPGTWYRKGYRGSSNDDIWICGADGTGNRRLTAFNGQDGSPMWGADGKYLFYVSDVHGTSANVVRQDVEGKSAPQLVTFHKDDNVRKARISANGQWIVYECGADLWVASTREGTPPRKLAIEVHADDKANTETSQTFTQGASEFALNKDETHMAFVVHGEVFLQRLSSTAKAVRLTDSPAFDHGLAWAPDSQKIVFASDRGGYEDLYVLESGDPDHPKLLEARQFKVSRLTDTTDAEFGASFAPDGKRIAFIRGGKLWTMNPDGTDPKAVVNDTQVFDYDWSPDSKWLVYSRSDGSFASELYIIPAAGGEAKNITRHATFNADVTWCPNGKKLSFISQRRRGMGIFVMPLQKPATASAPATTDIDWEDIHLRAEQVAPISADEGSISSDGLKVAFRSVGSSGDDLWVASADGRSLTRVTTGNQRPTQIRWSKRHFEVIYFRDGTGQLRMARPSLLGGATEGKPSTDSSVVVPFKVKMTVRRDEEFLEMFDQSWRALSDHFYDTKFHGIDWYAARAKYRPLVKHVALKEDLYTLVSLMMGELNASHTGISGFLSQPEAVTADLGLIFDESHPGPGLLVAEVLKRGPADKRGINLKKDDIILAIDGTELSPSGGKPAPNLSQLLNDKAGDTVLLQVASPGADLKDPKARRRVEVQPASRAQVSTLMYDRWVERNAARVKELSKGKLGYIHIPSMDEAGLDAFVRCLYSDSFDKDAIVLDVRFNGGGFTHDQVLNYLGAKEHTLFRSRFGGEGAVLRSHDRKWVRPLVLLINNRSYSDAEIFPSAFRTLGLGKLVGQPTGGHVIGTSSVRLIDGSQFRIPRLGVYTTTGVNMEKEGVRPDVLVEPHPDELARGRDGQLDKAVTVLLEDVAIWKKKNAASVASKPEEGKSPEPALPVIPPGK